MNRYICPVLLIIVTGFLAYSNTFHVPFHLDDRTGIVENREIKDLGTFIGPLKGEGSTLSHDVKMRYIAYLSFALNYRLHGLDVTGYHVVNLLIHVINAILVYFLVVLTFRSPLIREITNRELRIWKKN